MPQQSSAPQNLLGRLSQAAPALYLVVGGVLLVLCALLTPPFFNPDEAAHTERALEVAHGEWIAHDAPMGEQVTVLLDEIPAPDAPLHVETTTPQNTAYGTSLDRNFVLAGMRGTYVQREYIQRNRNWTQRPDGRFPPDRLDALKQMHWARSSIFVPFLNTAVYPAPFYLPAALAWRIGEARNASIVSTLYAARLCNALVALLLGWLALRLAGQNRLLLLAFLLLPAQLVIDSACAQDAILLPLMVLCVGVLLRVLQQQRLFRAGELLFLAPALALCAAGRPPYLALAVLLFLPSLELHALDPRRLLPPAAAFVGVVAGFGLWRFFIRHAGLARSAVAHPEQQIAFIKAHPLTALFVLVKGSLVGIPEMVLRGVEVLELKGLATMALGYGLHILAFTGIVLLARRVVLTRVSSKLLLGAAIAAIAAAIALVEYLIWNAPGSRTLLGVQARYYLPVLPFLFLFALRGRAAAAVFSSPRLLLGCVAVYFCGVLYTPFLLAQRYYALSLPSALAHVLR